MSCPSCQVGGRRLPSLPLGYAAKARENMTYKHLRNLNIVNRNFSLRPIGSLKLKEKNCNASLQSVEEIQNFLQHHPDVLDQFILKNVSQEQLEKWLIRKSGMNSNSTGSNAQRSLSKWKFCVHKDKRHLIERLTNEVNQQKEKSYIVNELAENIAQAIHASRYTVYLTDNSRKYLTTYSHKLSGDSHIVRQDIKTSATIAAYVARTKEVVNAAEVLGDDRFPVATGQDGTDLSVICHPIILNDGNLYGVVEFVKSADSLPFGEEDFEITNSYLAWGTVAVKYVEVVQQLQSFRNIDGFVNKVAQDLLKGEKSVSEMVDDITNFSLEATKSMHYVIYDVDADSKQLNTLLTSLRDVNSNTAQLSLSQNQGVAGQVLATNDVVSVNDAYTNPHFCRDVDVLTGLTTKTVLAAPVASRNGIANVIELINKCDGVFNDHDVRIIKLCASYYSLVQTFGTLKEQERKKSSEIAVLKEVLLYHGQPRNEDLQQVVRPQIMIDIPDDFYDVSFNYLKNSDQFGRWYLSMSEDIFKKIDFRYCDQAVVHFIAMVKNFYRELPYHTWDHAFSVAHFMYILLLDIGEKLPKLEVAALLLSCICHDLDHRGRNNAFNQNTGHPLSMLYEESLLENHHFYMTRFIMQQQKCDMFPYFTDSEKEELLALMKQYILATDLLKGFTYREKLEQIVDSGKFDWDCCEHRRLASFVMMTICDLCGSCKPWDIHRTCSKKVFEEFYQQADEEVAFGLTPLDMFVNKSDLPLNQIGFIKGVVRPCVLVLKPIIPCLVPVEEQLQNSVTRWEEQLKALDKTDEETKDKIKLLDLPGSTLQQNCISFIKYNCSGVAPLNEES